MKVVVAPDGFGGTLSAAEAAAAMASGWRAARPDDTVVTVPLADGGEGTLDVVVAALPAASVHTVEVVDTRGLATQARWLALPDARALVEVAEAIGLNRLSPDARDPLKATSYGAGQLIAAAIAAGAREVVVGLGGSATNDGGVGALIALGFRLLRADGNGVRVGGHWVATLDRIERGSATLGLRVVLAADVDNPLLGERGATAVFGPQKGADAAAVGELEAALAHLADVVERDVPGGPWRDRPGAGAAGGLGFALMAFLAAEIRSGAAVVAELVGLDAALEGADVAVTGEGSLDAQTASGKVVAHVAAQARAAGARVLAIAGRVSREGAALVDDAEALGPDGPTRAAEEVAAAASRLAARQTGGP